jgi:hypothetical protein
MIATLAHVSKYFNYLKYMDNLFNDTSLLTNCVCSIISVLSESKFNADRFISVIGVSYFKYFIRKNETKEEIS